MRRTAAEKYELIRLVEGSELPVRQTLRELRLTRSTFYRWYHRYRQHGRTGLEPRPAAARRYWNRIPLPVRQRVVDAALADPERSPRELAWRLTDQEGHFLSESSVYRILKAYDLIPSPAFIVLTAAKSFRHPTRRPNELWQTDCTYLQVVGWGWYYLSTVLDDYARYIIAWMLRSSMQAADVMETLDLARAKTGVDQIADTMGSTKKFVDFISEYLPSPPSVRPLGRVAQVCWESAEMRRHLKMIYSYCSRALHAGTPFPLPMTNPPMLGRQDETPEERPLGLIMSSHGAVWKAEDCPMCLHTFEYIVRESLNAWWQTSAGPTSPPN